MSTSSDNSANSIHHVTMSTSITVPAVRELEAMTQLLVKDGQWLKSKECTMIQF